MFLQSLDSRWTFISKHTSFYWCHCLQNISRRLATRQTCLYLRLAKGATTMVNEPERLADLKRQIVTGGEWTE